jgi:hypothetical protein
VSGPWNWPFKNSLNLLLVHDNASAQDHVAEICDRPYSKGTFGTFDEKLVLL